MKIMITGADSFVGSYLIPEIIRDKHRVLLIGKDGDWLNEEYNVNNSISYIDLEQAVLVDKIHFFKPNTVVHLAAYSTSNDSNDDFNLLVNANILFLGKILDAVKDIELKMFINTGSFAEYFDNPLVLDPAYLYTATKNAARFIIHYYAETYGFNYCTIAPYSLYGGIDTRKKVLDYLFDSLDSNTQLDLTPGEQVLDFIHVSDLIRLYMNVISGSYIDIHKKTFHAGTGIGSTLKEVLSLLEKYTNKTANVKWGGRCYRKRDIMYAVADISLQQKLYKWEASIQLDKGIQLYVEENKKNTNQK